jgi:multicomponent K+:H+ antiporter subunit A
MRRLDGLYRSMPITGTLAIVACGAMAGVPLLNGFLSKEMFFAETVFLSSHPWVERTLPIAAMLAGMFAVVYALRFGHDVFFGPEARDLPSRPNEPIHWMRVPVELLVLVCLIVGIFPAWSVGPLLATAALPVVGGMLPEYSLAIWHGFNAPLLMSLVAMAGGLLIYRRYAVWFVARKSSRIPGMHRISGKRLYVAAMRALVAGARRTLRRTCTHRLQMQLLCLLVIAFAAAVASTRIVPFTWGERATLPPAPAFVLLWFIGAVCALGAAWQAKFHRLAALTMLSVVGLALCLTFAWFSAPDLALTQLAVEVMTTVLFLLGLRWLPKRVERDAPLIIRRVRRRRWRDVVVALVIGIGMAALSYALQTRNGDLSISPFFLERAVPDGGGANVVNVILVDFRAFDTLGEITVLGIVSLTIFALLRRFRPPRAAIVVPEQQLAGADEVGYDLGGKGDPAAALPAYLVVPAVLVRLLLPMAGVFAVYLFLRGHNEPGGGFVAGLVLSIAFLAQYMVSGTRWVEERMNLQPPRWIGWGMVAALATGLGSLLFGYPAFTTHTVHFTVPLLGEIHVPSAAFFDLGVFLVVVGATLLMLTALAHQSLRSRRRNTPYDIDEAGEP